MSPYRIGGSGMILPPYSLWFLPGPHYRAFFEYYNPDILI